MTISMVFMILALIMLILAAANFPKESPVSFGWLGMAFWALAIIVGGR